MVLLSLLPFIGLAVACADHELHARGDYDHAHAHEKRLYPKVPLTPPYRPLVWGDFNVIHTTDTHGWLLGHQKESWPEPNYSGDLGDFASFVAHMKDIALQKDVDLLLVDSGDLHDGTGLSDGYPPGGVDAHESNKFLELLPYDLMTIGNHELYVYADTYDMYTNFVPNMEGRYLSSNANITVFNAVGEAVSVPVGNRFRKFTTRKGRSVTSLGVLYDFKGNSQNTTVQFVANMVKEQWFAEVIADEPDLFLLIGHMPIYHDNWPVVFDAIRAVHPSTPILIFGGHTHIRDCQQYDGRSMALESGRYMETIGWMSAELDAAKGNTNNITFSRRYLDQNRVTYEYHTKTSNSTFDTSLGLNITAGLEELAVAFDLGFFYGTAPQDYTLDRNPYPSNGSLLTLYVSEAAPVALTINNTRADIPNIIISDSGELRFDVLKGSFTKNDLLTASPYTDMFFYIANVKVSAAVQIVPGLNQGPFSKRGVEVDTHGRDDVDARYRAWLQQMSVDSGLENDNQTKLNPGYVTKDRCGSEGDDTLHTPVPYFATPNFLGSDPPGGLTPDTPIDVVFVDFIEKDILAVLNTVQTEHNYTSADVSLYTPTLANAILGLYAQAHWN